MKENKRPTYQTKLIDKTTPSYNNTPVVMMYPRKGPPDYNYFYDELQHKRNEDLKIALLEAKVKKEQEKFK